MTDTRPPIVFGQPCFDDEELDAATAVIRSTWIGQGPVVLSFERALATYVGAGEAVAVSSCTAALHLALLAAGVAPGDEVVSTPFTFVATINAIEHCGARPVLVDIEPDTLNVTADSVAGAVSARTRAVLPVHFGGRPVEHAPLRALADESGFWIVEDAAHAIGALQAGMHVGGSRHPRTMACFSFYPNKNLATAEGGAITLEDHDAAERLRSLRLHGMASDAWDRYRVASYRPALATERGFKYNMTDLQASIAQVQLAKLEGFLAIREFLADRYDGALRGLDGVQLLAPRRSGFLDRHALHLYQVAVADWVDRDGLVDSLRRRNIGAAVHYIGVNRHPYYRDQFAGQRFPVSDWASEKVISLPLHPRMLAADVDRVVGELDAAIADQRAARRLRSRSSSTKPPTHLEEPSDAG